jgi:hypothetical protein
LIYREVTKLLDYIPKLAGLPLGGLNEDKPNPRETGLRNAERQGVLITSTVPLRTGPLTLGKHHPHRVLLQYECVP